MRVQKIVNELGLEQNFRDTQRRKEKAVINDSEMNSQGMPSIENTDMFIGADSEDDTL